MPAGKAMKMYGKLFPNYVEPKGTVNYYIDRGQSFKKQGKSQLAIGQFEEALRVVRMQHGFGKLNWKTMWLSVELYDLGRNREARQIWCDLILRQTGAACSRSANVTSRRAQFAAGAINFDGEDPDSTSIHDALLIASEGRYREAIAQLYNPSSEFREYTNYYIGLALAALGQCHEARLQWLSLLQDYEGPEPLSVSDAQIRAMKQFLRPCP